MKLSLQHISKSFGDNKVLQDISFTIKKGSITILMGTNGSGKTTLFNIISGFLEEDGGEVWIDEKNTNRLPHYKMNRLGISRTFQDMRLVGDLAEEILIMYFSPYGFSGKTIKKS